MQVVDVHVPGPKVCLLYMRCCSLVISFSIPHLMLNVTLHMGVPYVHGRKRAFLAAVLLLWAVYHQARECSNPDGGGHQHTDADLGSVHHGTVASIPCLTDSWIRCLYCWDHRVLPRCWPHYSEIPGLAREKTRRKWREWTIEPNKPWYFLKTVQSVLCSLSPYHFMNHIICQFVWYLLKINKLQ